MGKRMDKVTETLGDLLLPVLLGLMLIALPFALSHGW
jgi:hypothetical protein